MRDKMFEKRVIYAHELRQLCINRQWFTRADCETYDRFLNMVYIDPAHMKHKDIDTETLQDMAEMVQTYSDLDDEVTIASIMFRLARIRVSFFGMVDFREYDELTDFRS